MVNIFAFPEDSITYTHKVAILTTELKVSLQLWSCSDMAFTRRSLKKPTFVLSCHDSLPSSECLVQRCRSSRNMPHALAQVSIAAFDWLAIVPPSNSHSGSSTV